MALPGVTQSILDGQVGAVPVTAGDVPVIIGVSSAGDADTPRLYAGNQIASLVSDFGYGPGPQMAALILARGKQCVFVKAVTTTAGDAGTVTKTGGGDAVPTADGANDTYHVRVEVLTGGALGTAGIVFRYSLDNGLTFSPQVRLGTALTYEIPNSGITLTWGASAATVTSTTRLEFRTFEPVAGTTEIAAAFAGYKASTVSGDWFHVVGPSTSTEATAIKSELTSLEGSKRYTAAFLEARRQDYATSETEADWMTDIVTDFESFDSKRIVVGAGECRVFSPLDKRIYMRPATWPAVVRAVSVDAAKYELGRVKDDGFGGALDCAITDAKGNPIAHNEETTPGLDTTGTGGSARFLTLRTHPTKGSRVYATRTPLMSAPGSDFSSFRLRRCMDIGCTGTLATLTDEIQETPPLKANGTIDEVAAKVIESRVNSRLREDLIKTGRVSPGTDDEPGAHFVLNRTDNILSTKKIKGKTRLLPLGQIDFIEVELGFSNPALTTEEV